MVKIISGYSKQGGSTEAFINLTNELNRRGYKAMFYGPHPYHMNKCRGGLFSGGVVQTDRSDSIIVHLLNLQFRPPAKSVVFSCHEQYGFNFNGFNFDAIDKIHFVSNHQKNYHKIPQEKKGQFVVCNIYDDLKEEPAPTAAGIVGLMFAQKGTHLAIDDAIKDGFKKVLLFGYIPDNAYYEKEIVPRIAKSGGIVEYRGCYTDKQAMYNQFTDLYIHSESECLPTVVAEARLTGKTVHIPDDKNYKNAEYCFDRDAIINTWAKELKLD